MGAAYIKCAESYSAGGKRGREDFFGKYLTILFLYPIYWSYWGLKAGSTLDLDGFFIVHIVTDRSTYK